MNSIIFALICFSLGCIASVLKDELDSWLCTRRYFKCKDAESGIHDKAGIYGGVLEDDVLELEEDREERKIREGEPNFYA